MASSVFLGGRLSVSLVSLLLVIACPKPLIAEPQLSSSLRVNQTTFQPGQTLFVSITVSNPGLAATADFYVGMRLPDGVTIRALTGAQLRPVVASQADLRSLPPIAAGIPLHAAFEVNVAGFLTHTWSDIEPVGRYLFFFAVVTHGALDDGSLQANELLSLSTAEFVLYTP